MTNDVVDELARQGLRDHEKLCAERLGNIGKQLDMIIKIGGWAGALTAAIVLGTLGYLAKSQIETAQMQLSALHSLPQRIVITTSDPNLKAYPEPPPADQGK